jgi:putative redox protein
MSEETKTARVSLEQGLRVSMDAAGHLLIADEPEDKGGTDQGPTPMHYFLAGLGACTAMTLRMYANVKGWELERVDVEVSERWVTREEWPEFPEGEERDRVPRITRKIRVTGRLDEKQIERLHYIANRCPVHRVVTENPYVVDELTLAG